MITLHEFTRRRLYMTITYILLRINNTGTTGLEYHSKINFVTNLLTDLLEEVRQIQRRKKITYYKHMMDRLDNTELYKDIEVIDSIDKLDNIRETTSFIWVKVSEGAYELFTFGLVHKVLPRILKNTDLSKQTSPYHIIIGNSDHSSAVNLICYSELEYIMMVWALSMISNSIQSNMRGKTFGWISGCLHNLVLYNNIYLDSVHGENLETSEHIMVMNFLNKYTNRLSLYKHDVLFGTTKSEHWNLLYKLKTIRHVRKTKKLVNTVLDKLLDEFNYSISR
jgi:hypothetical protein